MSSRYCHDIAQVGLANFLALAISWGEFEMAIRILGLVAALIYTVIRIVQALRE